eukprot:Opistho-1_new@17705
MGSRERIHLCGFVAVLAVGLAMCASPSQALCPSVLAGAWGDAALNFTLSCNVANGNVTGTLWKDGVANGVRVTCQDNMAGTVNLTVEFTAGTFLGKFALGQVIVPTDADVGTMKLSINTPADSVGSLTRPSAAASDGTWANDDSVTRADATAGTEAAKGIDFAVCQSAPGSTIVLYAMSKAQYVMTSTYMLKNYTFVGLRSDSGSTAVVLMPYVKKGVLMPQYTSLEFRNIGVFLSTALTISYGGSFTLTDVVLYADSLYSGYVGTSTGRITLTRVNVVSAVPPDDTDLVNSLFYITRSPLVSARFTVKDSNFTEIYGEESGLILWADNAIVSIEGSRFEYVQSFSSKRKIVGGAFSLISCRTTITRSVFIANGADVGGAVYAYNNDNSTFSTTLSVSQTLFAGCFANQGGAIGVVSDSKSTAAASVDIDNCVFDSNYVFQKGSDYGAGCALHIGGSGTETRAYVHDCIMRDNNALDGSNDGGVFNVVGGGELAVERTDFTGNSGYFGGVLFAHETDANRHITVTFRQNVTFHENNGIEGILHALGDDVFLTVERIVFEGNTAMTGGAIDVQARATLTSIGCVYTRNSVMGDGGAIAIDRGIVYLTNDTFVSNIAKGNGGAIHMEQYANVTDVVLSIQGALFDKNSAAQGEGGSLFIAKSVSGSNRDGGAPHDPTDDMVSVIVKDTTFRNSNGLSGGAVKIQSYVVAQMSRIIAEDNKSDYGGFIYAVGNSRTLIRDSVIRRNTASAAGAVATDDSAFMRIVNTEMTSCSSDLLGGVVLAGLDSEVIIENSLADMNKAGESGGFLALQNRAKATLLNTYITHQAAGEAGGAVCATGGTKLVIQNCAILQCCAYAYGGALRGSGTSAVSLTNVTMSGNRATTGGGVHMKNSAIFFMRDGTITLNSAVAGGGGIALEDSVRATMTTTSISSNRAGTAGGGVSIYGGVSCTIDKSYISNNTARTGGGIYAESAAGFASNCADADASEATSGALHISARAQAHTLGRFSLTLTNATGNGNSAFAGNASRDAQSKSSHGGFAMLVGGVTSIGDGSFLSGNSADGRGGAIAFVPSTTDTVQSPASLTLTSARVEGNSASSSGGGVYMELSAFTAAAFGPSVRFGSNSADNGGALFVATPAYFPSGVGNVTYGAGNVARLSGSQMTTPGTRLGTVGQIPPIVYQGDTLPAISLTLYDASGAVSKTSGAEAEIAVSVVSATDPSSTGGAYLVGGNNRNLVDGATTYDRIQVFGPAGRYKLVFRMTGGLNPTVALDFQLPDCNSVPSRTFFVVNNRTACVKVFDINKGLRAAFVALGALGDALAVSMIGVVIVLGDKEIIKASSPRFCLILAAGCMIGYTVIFAASPEANDATCISAQWLGHVGFAITFGALFAKNYRIMAIFNNKKMRQRLRATSDTFLLSLVSGAVAIVIIYLIIWMAVDTPKPKAILDDSTGVLRYSCESKSNLWPLALYVVEGVSLVWGAVLAYRTRKVPSKFNESKFIGFSIWNIGVISAIILPLVYFVDTANPDTQFMFQSVGIMLSTTGVLLFMFVPKLHAYRKGEVSKLQTTVLSSMTSSNDINSSLGGGGQEVNELRLVEAKHAVDELKSKYERAVQENGDLWAELDLLKERLKKYEGNAPKMPERTESQSDLLADDGNKI